MIYLIRCTWYDFTTSSIIDLVKIGYTGDFNKRWNDYKIHNPLCTILSTIEDGTKDDEKRLHYHFKDLIYPGYGKEWFTYNHSIIDFFDTHRTSESLNSMPIKEEKPLSDYMELKNWYSKNKENLSEGIRKWLDFYFKNNLFRERLKIFCESLYLTKEDKDFLLNKLPIELPFKEYYLTLGSARCKALSYARNELQNELNLLKFDQKDLKRELDFIFKIGEVYALSEIKEKLGILYESLGYMKTPKANDLLEHYEVKNCMKSINKKRIACYKIIKKL